MESSNLHALHALCPGVMSGHRGSQRAASLFLIFTQIHTPAKYHPFATSKRLLLGGSVLS